MKKIAILLSTYNGKEYIERQITSIYQQSYSDFELYIRDDGSNLAFLEQLRRLQQEYHFVLLEGSNKGFVASFMTLLDAIGNADLYAFADQDDIWLPKKLQCAVDWFEGQNEEVPLLYHSAYDVIDENEHIIDRFYFPDQEYDFRRTITENHYSGFAMVINKKLREYMLQGDTKYIGYHDWWAAMIVHAFGIAHSDPEVMALHRAHGNNVTTFNFKTRIQWLCKTLSEQSELDERAKEFERCFGEKLDQWNRGILAMFTANKYSFCNALKKACYPKRWRPIISSELTIRFLMLIGKI